MLSTLTAVLTNGSVIRWGLLGCVVVGSAWYYFPGIRGVVWKLLTDVRTWVAVLAGAGYLAFADVHHKLEETNALLAHQTQETRGAKDGQTVTDTRVKQKTRRAQEHTKIEDAINHATPDTAEDAAMDEIARLQPRSTDAGAQPHVVRDYSGDGVVRP
jgi:hypothetical protein